jgi:hypothetical protein
MDGSLIYECIGDQKAGELTEVGKSILIKLIQAEARCHGKGDEYREAFTVEEEAAPEDEGERKADRPRSRKRKNRNEARDPTLYDLYHSANMIDELVNFLNSGDFKDRAADLAAAFEPHATGVGGPAEFKRRIDRRGDRKLEKDDLKQLPINGHTLRKLALFDLRVPIGFIFARRHIVFEAGQYIAMRDGPETGVTYTSKTIINLSRNTKQRLVGVDLNFDHCTAIFPESRKNLIYIPDVLITNYHGGYDMSIYKRDAAETLHAGSAEDADGVKSGLVLAVHGSFRPAHPYIDVTGHLNRDNVVHNTNVSELMYPTAEEYKQAWRFPPPRNLFHKSSFVDQDPYAQTLCLQGYQEYSVPHDQLPHPDAARVLGQGHIGSIITQSTFKCYRGELVHMTD